MKLIFLLEQKSTLCIICSLITVLIILYLNVDIKDKKLEKIIIVLFCIGLIILLISLGFYLEKTY